MPYHATITRLADATAARLLAIWEALTDNDIDDDEAEAVITASVAKANNRARLLGTLGAAVAIQQQQRVLSRASPPLPLPPDDVPRLAKAARTVLDTARDSDDPEAIMARLGRAEPLQAAAQARSEAITAHPQVTGWRRDVNVGACTLCVWWAQDGHIFPADLTMSTHPGCSCVQAPTTER